VRGKDSRRLVYHLLGMKANLFSNPAAGTPSAFKRRSEIKHSIACEHCQE